MLYSLWTYTIREQPNKLCMFPYNKVEYVVFESKEKKRARKNIKLQFIFVIFFFSYREATPEPLVPLFITNIWRIISRVSYTYKIKVRVMTTAWHNSCVLFFIKIVSSPFLFRGPVSCRRRKRTTVHRGNNQRFIIEICSKCIMARYVLMTNCLSTRLNENRCFFLFLLNCIRNRCREGL